MLRADNSEFLLDYGFTQDDVDWEAHFTGPDGNGYVLAFRPDLDLAAVSRAVEAGAGPLDGARVIAEDHLVVAGTAEDGEGSGRTTRRGTAWSASPRRRRTCGAAASP